MGLDMNLVRVKGVWTQERLSKAAWEHSNGNNSLQLEGEDICYWRKHSDLHGFFNKLYYETTPKAYQMESFNMEYVVVTRDIIADLIGKAARQLAGDQAFEHAQGYFWGKSYPEDWEDTIKFLTDALTSTNFEEETILYCSCW